ncbi:MAG TPA: Hpt domain-containing protein, partial [Tepidisphaeraceae bacterium]
MQPLETAQIEFPSPLNTISGLIQQVSAAVLAADADDLTALAAVHTCFQQLKTEAAMVREHQWGNSLEQSSAAAEKVVEQIILRELDDTNAALRQLNDTVSGLQQLLREANGEAPAAPAPVISSTPAKPVTRHETAHAVIEAETAINLDDVSLALEFISEARTHIESAEANLLRLEEQPDDLEAVNAIFRSFHTVKGVSGFLNLKQIGALAHAAENLLDLARKGQLELVGTKVDVVLESIDLLKVLLDLLDASLKTNQPTAVEPRLPHLLQKLHAELTGTPVADAAAPAAEHATFPLDAAPAPTAEAAKSAPAAEAKSHETSHGDGTVKVSTERLDSLINMVGELVISQSMVTQDVAAVAAANPRVIRNMSHLGKITRELQDLSMSMRMVPIQGVFQKMARVVRDIARKAGKEIDFVVVGGETELDRNVVEAIGDPLVHMVRNSVDHGIEPPSERLAGGKHRAGRLELRARHQAGRIIIEIVDDGRGLNTQKILKKAIDNGIVKEGEQLTEQEIFQLIFAAGLSTADKITDISG